MLEFLLATTLLGWLAGFYFLYRLHFCPNTGAPDAILDGAQLSIVIPARNEEDNLQRLLPSIRQQKSAILEIIVVNDASTDATKAVAERYGARVLDAPPLPQGWTGKCNACYFGANQAKGDWLLFLDADLEFEPDGLHRLLRLPLLHPGVISVAPYHRISRWYEELSGLFNIIMLAGINAFTPQGNAAANKRLFGQLLLISKNHYAQVGGHESVKDKILENFFLAERLNAARIPIFCYAGRGTVSMRMFPHGLRQLIEGWIKAFAQGAAHTPPAILVGTIFWISGALSSFFMLFFSTLFGLHPWIVPYAASLYLLFTVQIYWFYRGIGNFSFCNALFYPVGLLFYNIVFMRSLYLKMMRRQVRWKERDVLDAS